MRLQDTTIKKSSLFQCEFLRNFLNPCIFIFKHKSTVTVRHIINSNAMKNGELATLNPSTTVIATKMKQINISAT